MANNELTVVRADGTTKTLRDDELGSAHVQYVAAIEGLEQTPTLTGATERYSIDADPAVALDPPTGGARYARVRAYHTAFDPAAVGKRLYYRKDGTTPTSDGANAQGFLLHAEAILIRQADFTDVLFIGESGMTGTFELYVEWLDTPAS